MVWSTKSKEWNELTQIQSFQPLNTPEKKILPSVTIWSVYLCDAVKV